MWGSERSSLFRWLVSVDHPGLEEAPSGGVATGSSHMGLSPINRMTSRVCMFR